MFRKVRQEILRIKETHLKQTLVNNKNYLRGVCLLTMATLVATSTESTSFPYMKGLNAVGGGGETDGL